MVTRAAHALHLSRSFHTLALVTVDGVCRIVADVGEQWSGVPEALESGGVRVSLRRLRAGDYELGNGVCVERKTISDLHHSLERGRLWRQIGLIRRSTRLPYLLIEGGDLDRGPLEPSAIRGACLAVIGQGVAVLMSRDSIDSALWLRLLAERTSGIRPSRDRPVYAQKLKPPAALVSEAMLAAVPGISVVRARSLLRRFGSVSGVVRAGHEAWMTVPGIGPAGAEALRRALG